MSDTKKPADRVDMRLYNTIIVFDVYTIARSAEAARAAILAAIADGLDAQEMVAKEVTHERSIRASWVDQTPYVAPEVSDEELALLKGMNTLEVFQRLYKKG